MKGKLFIIIASVIAVFSLIATAVFFCVGLYYYKNIDFELDDEMFKRAKTDGSTIFLAYADDEKLLEVWRDDSNGKKEWCSLNDIGTYLKQGFISMEDREFYSHSGINIKRTLAAFVNYLTPKKEKFGASTITQQVIKNISGDNELSLGRKMKEIIRAIKLEKKYTKDEILEMYINIVPMSGNMYGVQAASEVYFGKQPGELTLAEAATIVGITNSPGHYNPYKNHKACLEKRNRVLYAMKDCGAICDEEYYTAIAEPLNVKEMPEKEVSSWFVETAREDIIYDLKKKYNLNDSGAKLLLRGCTVILTEDPTVQNLLDSYFQNEDNFPQEVKRGLNYSFAVVDNRTGNLIGVVGNALKKQGELLMNYAQSPVIPGSTLKPLALYAPLLEEKKINYSTVFDDAPVKIYRDNIEMRGYPQNCPREYSGLITVADALRLSKNTVAVRLLEMLGKRKAFDLLEQKYNFSLVKERKNKNGKIYTDIDIAPLALGQLTDGIALRDLVNAYSAFAREGIISECKSYYGVFSADGRVLLENEKSEKRIYTEQTSEIMNQLLMNVVDSGTAWNITLKEMIDVAGKTGTSGNDYDRLFVGYTPYYTAGIWCGYSNSKKSIGQLWPSHMNIWDDVMTKIHKEKIFNSSLEEPKSFSVKGLLYLPFCLDSGQRYTDVCDLDLRGNRIAYGYFSKDNCPECDCQRHILFAYDTESGEVVFDLNGINREDIVFISLVNYKRDLPGEIVIADKDYLINDLTEFSQTEITDLSFIKKKLVKRKC